MALTIDGQPILKAELIEPRVGAWTANIEADLDEDLSGQVTVDIDGETFVGTIIDAKDDEGRWKGFLVGGSGALNTMLEGKHYVTPTVGTVLASIMAECGETLAPEIDSAITSRVLPRWSRFAGEAHQSIRVLAETLGLDWKVTRAGTIWLGTPSWTETTATYIEIEAATQEGRVQIAYDGEDELDDPPVIAPGQLIGGRKIQEVVIYATDSDIRQDLFVGDQLADELAPVRAFMMPQLQFSRLWAGKIVKQETDGSVSLLLDDPEIAARWKGLDKVPIVHGLPGITLITTNGARVRLLWDGGNPSRPRAALWDTGAPVQQITMTFQASGKLRVVGDLEVTGEVTANSDTAPVELSTHVHPTAMGPSGAPTPGTP